MISWLSKMIIRLVGWKIVGRYPHEIKKKVLIVAPHSSSWDFPLGLLVKFSLKIDAYFYGKKELFKGIVGWILTLIGGRPVDRSKPNNLVRQIVSDFDNNERYAIVLTPEGTRKKVESFKSGYYFIADKAKAPIIPISFDYEKKTVTIMKPFYTTGNVKKELAEIENLFKEVKGKNIEQSFG